MTSLDDEAIAEQAADWWGRRGQGGAPARAAFAAWLAADVRHGEAFDAVAAAWDEFDIGEDEGAFEDAAIVQALDEARRKRLARGAMVRRFWVGAGLAACLAAGAVWIGRFSTQDLEFSTGVGQRLTEHLADGSTLNLDANTRVKLHFTHVRRQIYLAQGRAMFDVAHDPSKPFSVETQGGTVTDIGTAFSVEYRGAQTSVVLFRGRVRAVDNAPDHKAFDMAPGDALRMGSNGQAQLSSNTDLSRALLWQDGRLVFDNQSLTDVVARMNDYSGQPIQLTDPSLGRLHINGIFQAGHDEAFLKALQTYYGLTVTRAKGAVLIGSGKSKA